MEACRIDLGSQPLNSLKESKQARQAAKGEGKTALLPSTNRQGEVVERKQVLRTRKQNRLLLRGERGECEPALDLTLAELELPSHGSLWEAGNPDCWSGGIISFHMSLPGEDGQELASLPGNGWIWGKHLGHSTSVLIRHRKRMPHGPPNLSRGSSKLPKRKGFFSTYFIVWNDGGMSVLLNWH